MEILKNHFGGNNTYIFKVYGMVHVVNGCTIFNYDNADVRDEVFYDEDVDKETQSELAIISSELKSDATIEQILTAIGDSSFVPQYRKNNRLDVEDLFEYVFSNATLRDIVNSFGDLRLSAWIIENILKHKEFIDMPYNDKNLFMKKLIIYNERGIRTDEIEEMMRIDYFHGNCSLLRDIMVIYISRKQHTEYFETGFYIAFGKLPVSYHDSILKLLLKEDMHNSLIIMDCNTWVHNVLKKKLGEKFDTMINHLLILIYIDNYKSLYFANNYMIDNLTHKEYYYGNNDPEIKKRLNGIVESAKRSIECFGVLHGIIKE